ncbi:ovochymase-2-like [Uloborus diversus]|uniref:ovochymase-2-like n=1 Tax=Uloborus diversus TaxID=327109 RepID=UPI00240A3D99|nr:ovochymase-2-like [Uloborus diversus]
MWIGLLYFSSLAFICNGRVLDEGCRDLKELPIKDVGPKIIQVTGKGTLYSPGFEKNQNYPDSVQCTYQLQAPTGMHVRLTFNELDIDTTDSCEADSVKIHEFNSDGKGFVVAVLCGSRVPYDYVADSHAVQVTLTTDEFGNRRGFNITYSPQSTSSVCPSGKKMCRNRKCVDYSQVCDGNDNCGDGTDEEKCTVTLPTTECGKSEISPKPMSFLDRIVGGQEVTEGSWPWMADLQERLVEPNGHMCGGVLISAQWVLSAAHCFGGLRRPDDWRIHLGNHRKFDVDVGEQIRYPERIIIYDDISPTTFEQNGIYDFMHDIALIKLNAPVKFTKYVKPVCLPDMMTTLDANSNCYAIGWGATRGSGSSDKLKQAHHPIQEDEFCGELVGILFNPDTMICAGSLAPLNGVCHGDSGGPLLCEEKGKWSVHGVASYVTADTEIEGLCGLEGNPSVFSKISEKIEYIIRMVDKYS